MTYDQYRSLIAIAERTPGAYVETRDPKGPYMQVDARRVDVCIGCNALLCATLIVLYLRCVCLPGLRWPAQRLATRCIQVVFTRHRVSTSKEFDVRT